MKHLDVLAAVMATGSPMFGRAPYYTRNTFTRKEWLRRKARRRAERTSKRRNRRRR